MKKILVIIMLMSMLGAVHAAAELPGGKWRYDFIAGDAILASSGTSFWMIQTGADHSMVGSWFCGVRSFYWEENRDIFKNVYALDSHLTKVMVAIRQVQISLSAGIGIYGSRNNEEEHPIRISADVGMNCEFMIQPWLSFDVNATAMVCKEMQVIPFWTGMQAHLTPRLWLGAGLGGVIAIQEQSQLVEWKTAPSLRFSILL